MFRRLRKRFIRQRTQVSFDEVLVDALNIARVDTDRLEGKREMPISATRLICVGVAFLLVAGWFTYRLITIQIVQGSDFYARSLNNSLGSEVIIAERGVITDRNGEPLAWNDADPEGAHDFPIRAYTARRGLGPVLGYVNAPRKDGKGFYYRTEYKGLSGIEASANDLLAGTNGTRFFEEDVHGDVVSQHTVDAPVAGHSLQLSLDAELCEVIHDVLETSTAQTGFRSGAAAIMGVDTGEVLAMSGFPSYDPNIFSNGTDAKAIAALSDDDRMPLLNKIVSASYIPGSIVKPFVAYAALAEQVIGEHTELFSNGRLVVPNKYNPDQPTIFHDWRAQGYTDMRRAIAQSADVYFYTIGGGTPEQEGLGIERYATWMRYFGFGSETGIDLGGERAGVVPDPEWKKRVFGEDWRLGDSYITSIGQFGWQVTPIQMLVAYASIANGGTRVIPTLYKDAVMTKTDLDLDQHYLDVILDGMRQGVATDGGTVRGLDLKDVAIAAKSGTAEVDTAKTMVNTWVVGFFPYEKPKYAFVLFMERGPYDNSLGASWVMRDVMQWIIDNRPEYIMAASNPSDMDTEDGAMPTE